MYVRICVCFPLQDSEEGSAKVRGCVTSVAEFCSDQSQSSFVSCYDNKCNHWSLGQNRQLRIAIDGMETGRSEGEGEG